MQIAKIKNEISTEMTMCRVLNNPRLKSVYESGQSKGAMWVMWLHGMPRAERIGHLKAAILIRSEKATENRKENLRRLWRCLSKIEKADFAQA